MAETRTPASDDPEAVLVEETRAGRYQVAVDAGGTQFLADEPTAVGGLGSGPNPYDLMSAALGSCTAMTLRLYADRKGWLLRRARVRVVHVRATLNARDRFEREITLEGPLDETQRAKLLDIANRCPVHVTLERGADVSTVVVPTGDVAGEADPVETDQHMRHMAEAYVEEERAADA